MRFKLTLFLLLANIVTFGLIWKFQHDLSLPPATEALLFPANIRKIEVSGAGVAEPWTIEKKQHLWQITAPFTWEAGNAAVETIINQLNFTKLEGSFTLAEAIENGNKPESYGLDNPKLKITVSGANNTPPTIVKIGQPAGGSIVYMQTEDEQIVRVPDELLACFMLPLNDLRARSVFTIQDFEVNNIGVRLSAGGSDNLISLRRKQKDVPGQIDFEQVWRFETPLDTAASANRVTAFLARLSKIKCAKFIPGARADQAAYGLTAPAMRITLGTGGTGGSQTLLVGQTDPDSPEAAYFAKLEDNNTAVFTVPASEIEEWKHARTSLREHNFVSFYPAQLERIVIRKNGTSLVLLRLENKETKADPGTDLLAPPVINDTASNEAVGEWNIPALPGSNAPVTMAADPGEMAELIYTLRNLCAEDMPLPEGQKLSPEKQKLYTAFTNDAPTADERKTLGFDTPARRVELRLRDGTQTTLLLAPPVDADSPYHAKLDEQPSVYAVPDITEKLSVEPNQYRQRLIEQLPVTMQITGVKITDIETKKTLVDEQRPDMRVSWNAAIAGKKPEEQTEIINLLHQLVSIRAEKFRTENFSPEFTVRHLGAEMPEGWRYQLDVTVRPAAGGAPETRTWFFTKRLGGTTQLAGSARYNCVFEIPQPLIDALQPVTFERDIPANVPEVKQPADLPPEPAQ